MVTNSATSMKSRGSRGSKSNDLHGYYLKKDNRARGTRRPQSIIDLRILINIGPTRLCIPYRRDAALTYQRTPCHALNACADTLGTASVSPWSRV